MNLRRRLYKDCCKIVLYHDDGMWTDFVAVHFYCLELEFGGIWERGDFCGAVGNCKCDRTEIGRTGEENEAACDGKPGAASAL